MKKIIRIILLFIVIALVFTITNYRNINRNNSEEVKVDQNNDNSNTITYDGLVVTIDDVILYDISKKEVGKLGKNVELEVTSVDNTYLKTTIVDNEYYLKTDNIESIEETLEYDIRYKNYIIYNENVVSNESKLYDRENNLVYSLNTAINSPIIIKEDNRYGIEFNNRLLYVNKEDVEVVSNDNTNLDNIKKIPVLNYHFFYDETSQEEIQDCNQSICHSKKQFISHLDYIKNNNIFTPTMEELEMYIDGQIQLPKSIVITIDDGWRMNIGVDLLEEYKLNATVFLISGWYENTDFLKNYNYVEFHSHGEKLHNQGVCPGGQGGAIKCLEKTKLLEDLAKSRSKLNNTTVFCYPFYEYNNYSIQVLKEAGFTMAFKGYDQYDNYVRVGSKKLELPRFVIYNSTSVENLKSYLN